MKSIKMTLVAMLILFTMSMSLDGCTDIASNKGYQDAAKDIYELGKQGAENAEAAESNADRAVSLFGTAKAVGTVVGAVVPGAQQAITVLEGILGAGVIIAGLFGAKKVKALNIEKGKTANWNEAIEAGIQEGDDPNVVKISVLKEVLDKTTKADFNKSGQAKI